MKQGKSLTKEGKIYMMNKIFLLFCVCLFLHASQNEDKQMNSEEINMKKIVISEFDAKHSTTWAVHDMVEILLKENVAIEKIHKDALASYWISESLRDFFYGGYSSFLFEIKRDEVLKKEVMHTLKSMGALKHLAYMEKQEKVFQSLSDQEKSAFLDAKYRGHIDKKVDKKVAGTDFKEIAKEEDLVKLHEAWLKSLKHFEIDSFEAKYAYLSKIVGKDIMKVTQESKDIYTFLSEWNKQKEIFDLERFRSVAVWGEIEKFYWKEWAPDARDIDAIHDEFYSFAVDGGGGHYLLWHYEGLEKEAPVVYFSSEGEMEFLAPTFAEYILTLPDTWSGKKIEQFLLELKASVFDEEIENYLDELFEEYEDEKNIELNTKQRALMLEKDIEKYLALASEKFSYNQYNLDEKHKFEELALRLKGDPLTPLDYLKAFEEIGERLLGK
jgi:hypothetical protein